MQVEKSVQTLMGKVVDKSVTEVSGVVRVAGWREGGGGGGLRGEGKCKCITEVDGEGQVFSSPELAQGKLLGYRDVYRPLYVWTSVTY